MDALGGNVAVAEITGRTPKAVSNWRKFSSFPSNTFVILKSALALKGYIAPDKLWSMAEATRSKVAS
jgi:hypothetical protein